MPNFTNCVVSCVKNIKKYLFLGLLFSLSYYFINYGMNHQVAVGLLNGQVELFDIEDPEKKPVILEYPGRHKNKKFFVQLIIDLPELDVMAVYYYHRNEGFVALWSKKDWSVISTFQEDKCFDFFPNSKHIVKQVAPGIVQVTDFFGNLVKDIVLYEKAWIKDFAFSGNGKRFIAWADNNIVKVWDAKDLLHEDVRVCPIDEYKVSVNESTCLVSDCKSALIEINADATCFVIYKEGISNLSCTLFDMRDRKKIKKISLSKKLDTYSFYNILFGERKTNMLFLGGYKKRLFQYDLLGLQKCLIFEDDQNFDLQNYLLGFLDNQDQLLVSYGKSDGKSEERLVVFDRASKKVVHVFELRNKEKNSSNLCGRLISACSLIKKKKDREWADAQGRIYFLRNGYYSGKQELETKLEIYNGEEFPVHKLFMIK